MRSIIVDSGALVAMFNKDDEEYEHVRKCVNAAGKLPLLTTWPCVTEAMHILGRLDHELALLAYIHRGGITVRDFAAVELDRFIAWMKKYHDRPMDFADASLVWLATETGMSEILTTDRADFETYRLSSGRRFRLL